MRSDIWSIIRLKITSRTNQSLIPLNHTERPFATTDNGARFIKRFACISVYIVSSTVWSLGLSGAFCTVLTRGGVEKEAVWGVKGGVVTAVVVGDDGANVE